MKRLLFVFFFVLLLPTQASASSLSDVQQPASSAWAVGDPGEGEKSRSTAQLVGSKYFDRFFFLGDVYETGTAEEFEKNYGFWDYADKTVPILGNHEYANRFSGYFPFWRSQLGREIPAYYSFWMSGWQVFALNSEEKLGKRSAQYAWLQSEIKKYPQQKRCRVILVHRPRWSAGQQGDYSRLEAIRALTERSVSTWISGHEHNMQYIYLKRTHQFVSGAAGRGPRPHYPVDGGQPGLRFSNVSGNGALRLVFKREGGKRLLQWRFIDTNNRLLRKGNIYCAVSNNASQF